MSRRRDVLEKEIELLQVPEDYKKQLHGFLQSLNPEPNRSKEVRNEMYVELENLINRNQPEDAGILLAAIICQDRMDDDHQVDWDRDQFIEALEGDLP